MSQLNPYLLENYKETYDYSNILWKGGLSDLPPAIITCAITGSNAGKEVNPNLPELADEQVEQTLEAYKAGASMVHIHCRNPANPCEMTDDPEVYTELSRRIREKCPDIIINNTCVGGRKRFGGGELAIDEPTPCGPMMLTSITACGEVASLDTSNYCSLMKLPARKPPLFGRDEPVVRETAYRITDTEAMQELEMMKSYTTKPA